MTFNANTTYIFVANHPGGSGSILSRISNFLFWSQSDFGRKRNRPFLICSRGQLAEREGYVFGLKCHNGIKRVWI